MTITPQKEALYSLVGSRASLYQRLFQQQRENAAPDAIDQTLSALATAESEIRRLSDEVNGEVWYRNFNATFAILEGQGTAILTALGELRGGQSVLQSEFQTVGETLTQLQLDFVSLSAEVAQVSAELGRSREHRARLQAAVDRIEAQMLAPGERERLIVQHDELLGQVVVLETRIAVIEARLAALLPEAAT